MNPKRVPDQLIETIRDRNDLIAVVSEYLPLKRSGQNYTGLCPFHHEKTPSFVVSPSKQIFHCFGCGVGGSLFQFLMKMEGISFPEALHRLAEKGGIPLPTRGDGHKTDQAKQEADAIYQLNEAIAAYFHKNLRERPEGAGALAYLHGRGITPATIKAFSIGFALPGYDNLLKVFGKRFPVSLLEKAGLISKKSGSSSPSRGKEGFFDRFRRRILFPIRTLRGEVAGFGGRVLDDSLPKYMNTPETTVFTKRKHLFGINHAKGKGIHSLIIVEGYLDAVMAHQAGIPNVAATLGTALTRDHLNLIRRVAEKVVLIFDPDEAGIRAVLRAAPLFLERGVAASVVSLPAGEDPDLYIRKNGKERFLQKVSEGEMLIDFSISKLVEAFPSKTIDDKKKIVEEIFPLIRRLKSHIEQSHYLKRLSDELAIKEEDLRKDFAERPDAAGAGVACRNREAASQPSRSEADSPPPKAEEVIARFLLRGVLDPSGLDNKLNPEDFTDSRVRGIISSFWDQGGSRWRVPVDVGINSMNEKTLALYSRLSVEELQCDDVKREGADCILSMQKKRLQHEGDEIQKRLKLAEKGGDITVIHSLEKKYLELKKE
ncbi:MAG: DNA primase, partial [Nitrospiria bacterium]